MKLGQVSESVVHHGTILACALGSGVDAARKDDATLPLNVVNIA
tara:strand:- start:204 stop:335 length:132 start_codon:yes stop_codon:yes gene_type:complete